MYDFGYRYDGLQNMTLRTQNGPSTLDMVSGTYQYAEAGAGPRQLTSVVDAANAQVANFTYDAAGRMTEDTGKMLTYNGLDQLVRVDLPGEMIPLLYSYGYNGQRTYTQHADGSEEYNFTESIRQESDGSGNVLRHHYLKIGARTVARVSMRDMETGTGGGAGIVAGPPSDTQDGSPLRTLLLLALSGLVAFMGLRQRRAHGTRAGPAWAVVPLLVLFLSNVSCGALFGSRHQATWTTEETIYFHQGFSAGPTMMTDTAGNVFEERRYEPFGVDIDTYSGVAGGTGATTGIDFSDEPLNILNKASDEDTKWSYHGARWVSPQTARWHTPDPIVMAPDAKFMVEPWALHPYEYVEQNPVVFWDPDGRDNVWVSRAKGAGGWLLEGVTGGVRCLWDCNVYDDFLRPALYPIESYHQEVDATSDLMYDTHHGSPEEQGAAGITLLFNTVVAFLPVKGFKRVRAAKAAKAASPLKHISQSRPKHVVNPGGQVGTLAWISGRALNCGKCAIAGELNMRGLPVTAKRHWRLRGMTHEAIAKAASAFGVTSRWRRFRSIGMLKKHLKNMGSGARAIVTARYRRGLGNGHAFNAVNVDGKIEFRDFSTGEAGYTILSEKAMNREFKGFQALDTAKGNVKTKE